VLNQWALPFEWFCVLNDWFVKVAVATGQGAGGGEVQPLPMLIVMPQVTCDV